MTIFTKKRVWVVWFIAECRTASSTKLGLYNDIFVNQRCIRHILIALVLRISPQRLLLGLPPIFVLAVPLNGLQYAVMRHLFGYQCAVAASPVRGAACWSPWRSACRGLGDRWRVHTNLCLCHQLANQFNHHFVVDMVVVSADDVGFAQFAFFQNEVNCWVVIIDVNPVTNLFTGAVQFGLDIAQNIGDLARNFSMCWLVDRNCWTIGNRPLMPKLRIRRVLACRWKLWCWSRGWMDCMACLRWNGWGRRVPNRQILRRSRYDGALAVLADIENGIGADDVGFRQMAMDCAENCRCGFRRQNAQWCRFQQLICPSTQHRKYRLPQIDLVSYWL